MLHRPADVAQNDQRTRLALAPLPLQRQQLAAVPQVAAHDPAQIQELAGVHRAAAPRAPLAHAPAHLLHQAFRLLYLFPGKRSKILAAQDFGLAVRLQRVNLDRFFLTLAAVISLRHRTSRHTQRLGHQPRVRDQFKPLLGRVGRFSPERAPRLVEQWVVFVAAHENRAGGLIDILFLADVNPCQRVRQVDHLAGAHIESHHAQQPTKQ